MTHSIDVNGLSKKYQLGLTHDGSIRDAANRMVRRVTGRNRKSDPVNALEHSDQMEDGEFWALRDLNFKVDEGEVVGIIGKNGAGKSTLLKLLSRITYPTSGRVELFGRVASLLEVGTGFHPELTGRENVYLNGAVLGMTRREITRQLEAIVSFAGVGQFLDTPVKRYSSGMTVRLGFAVAAHLDPEILIVDEVLAVGDIEFQNRCISKMQSVAESGKTVLFVSHNLASVRSLTTRTIVLSNGRIVFDGPSADGIARYVDENVNRGTSSGAVEDTKRTLPGLDERLRFAHLEIESIDGEGFLSADGHFRVAARIKSHSQQPHFRVGLTVYSQDETPIGSTFSQTLPGPDEGQDRLYRFDTKLSLAPGKYHCGISITNTRSGARQLHDSLADVLPFEVRQSGLSDSSDVGAWSPAWGFCRIEPMQIVAES